MVLTMVISPPVLRRIGSLRSCDLPLWLLLVRTMQQQQLWLARAMTVDAGNPVYASQLGWVEDSVFRLEDEERAAYAPPDVAAESAKEKARRRSEKTRRRALRRIQARRTGVAAPSLSPSSSGGSSTEPPPPSGLQLPDAVFGSHH